MYSDVMLDSNLIKPEDYNSARLAIRRLAMNLIPLVKSGASDEELRESVKEVKNVSRIATLTVLDAIQNGFQLPNAIEVTPNLYQGRYYVIRIKNSYYAYERNSNSEWFKVNIRIMKTTYFVNVDDKSVKDLVKK